MALPGRVRIQRRERRVVDRVGYGAAPWLWFIDAPPQKVMTWRAFCVCSANFAGRALACSGTRRANPCEALSSLIAPPAPLSLTCSAATCHAKTRIGVGFPVAYTSHNLASELFFRAQITTPCLCCSAAPYNSIRTWDWHGVSATPNKENCRRLAAIPFLGAHVPQ